MINYKLRKTKQMNKQPHRQTARLASYTVKKRTISISKKSCGGNLSNKQTEKPNKQDKKNHLVCKALNLDSGYAGLIPSSATDFLCDNR